MTDDIKRLFQNWNRIADLTRIRHPTAEQKAELAYRMAIHNNYAADGILPDNYVEVGDKPR